MIFGIRPLRNLFRAISSDLREERKLLARLEPQPLEVELLPDTAQHVVVDVPLVARPHQGPDLGVQELEPEARRHPKDLGRTGLVRLFESGADLYAVADVAGRRPTQETQRYLPRDGGRRGGWRSAREDRVSQVVGLPPNRRADPYRLATSPTLAPVA